MLVNITMYLDIFRYFFLIYILKIVYPNLD